MFSLVFVCVHGLSVRSRACDQADHEGTTEGSKSDLIFTYEQALWQASYSVTQRACLVVAAWGDAGGFIFTRQMIEERSTNYSFEQLVRD